VRARRQIWLARHHEKVIPGCIRCWIVTLKTEVRPSLPSLYATSVKPAASVANRPLRQAASIGIVQASLTYAWFDDIYVAPNVVNELGYKNSICGEPRIHCSRLSYRCGEG